MPRISRDALPRSGRGFIAGSAVVAALVVAGVAVSLGAAFHTQPTDQPASSRAVVLAVGGSTCGLQGLDRTGTALTSAPTTAWLTVGTMAAPSSPTAGPGRKQEGGLRSCFAHTVSGALFAVANVWAMGSDPRLYLDVLEQNTATGPGRTAALQQDIGPSNTGAAAQIAGFKVTSYSRTAATIDIAFQLSSGVQISFPTPVRWQDGDWKVELADDGTPVFRPTTLQSLTGYIPWAGTA